MPWASWSEVKHAGNRMKELKAGITLIYEKENALKKTMHLISCACLCECVSVYLLSVKGSSPIGLFCIGMQFTQIFLSLGSGCDAVFDIDHRVQRSKTLSQIQNQKQQPDLIRNIFVFVIIEAVMYFGLP